MRTPRYVNDCDTPGVCWICGDLADHSGRTHSAATGDRLTRHDIIGLLAAYPGIHKFAGVRPADPSHPYAHGALWTSHCTCGWVSEPADKDDDVWLQIAQHQEPFIMADIAAALGVRLSAT